MVLTRSMVTTKNIQGDEPRPTALERQVQTLMTVVEHLTKQNHDLEKQLCQRNARHNIQDKDQEGTSAERRNQEGVVMPQANQNDMTRAIHPSLIWLHPTLLQRCI